MPVDVARAADALMAAYNAKDFAAMERLIAPELDFAHYNRNFEIRSRDALMGVLRQFAADFFIDRKFEAPLRVLVSGDVVVREAWYAGAAKIDLPGFAEAGGAFRLKFCSVLRFNTEGLLIEWKDYG